MTEQRKPLAEVQFANGLKVVAWGLFAESQTMLADLWDSGVNIRQLYIDPIKGIRQGYTDIGDAVLEYKAAEKLAKLSPAEIAILNALGR